MATAQDLLKNQKRPSVPPITPDTTAFDAMRLMAEHNVGALLVEEKDGKVVGILSERDFVRKLEVQGQSSKTTQVRQIMTEKVIYVESTQSLEECMGIMNERHIRHLPVYKGETLLGVISIRDVLREIISEQKSMISHLEHYILGSK